MLALVQNAEFWVAVGLVIFFGILVFLKVPNSAARMLDERGAKIQAALNEAEALRADAQSLLASLKSRREAAEAMSAQMLADAEAEARQMQADAKVKLERQIERRTQLADRRIATAEGQAAAEVKAAAAELAAAVAGHVLATRLAGQGADPIADRAIAHMPARLQ